VEERKEKMTAKPEILTYDDYLALPEMMQRYEIVDGMLIMEPAPTIEHQLNSARIYRPLDDHVFAHRLGVVLYAPVDVMIQRSPLRTRQPDVLYISMERIVHYGFDSIENVPFLDFPPDLAVEIVSPSESKSKVFDKLKDYQAIGVDECWLIRKREKTVEVLQLTADTIESSGVFSGNQTIESQVLPQLALSVDTIFAPPDFLKWKKGSEK
jgi:Uma2 family endonuclease